MGAAESLKMSYDEMQAEIDRLNQCVNDFADITNTMSASVDALCDGWTSQATEVYRDDYNALAKNFSDTLEVVRRLIQSTSSYMADMQAVDASYSSSKVTVG